MVVPAPPHGRAAINGRLNQRIHLCTGLLERNGRYLLVASRYPNHPQPLWNLPGGRQDPGELLAQTLAREFLEETGLSIEVGELLYVCESYDGLTQFTNTTFRVSATGDPHLPASDAHIVGMQWVTPKELASKITVGVVRDPLLAYLGGDSKRYYGYAEAEISIEFAD